MVLHVSSSSSLLPTNNQPPSTPVPRLGLLATLELSWELPKVPEPQTLASFSARPLRRPHHRRPHRRPAHPAVPSLCDVARQPKSIAPTDTGIHDFFDSLLSPRGAFSVRRDHHLRSCHCCPFRTWAAVFQHWLPSASLVQYRCTGPVAVLGGDEVSWPASPAR